MTMCQNPLGGYCVKAKRSESTPLPMTHTPRYMLQNANVQAGCKPMSGTPQMF